MMQGSTSRSRSSSEPLPFSPRALHRSDLSKTNGLFESRTETIVNRANVTRPSDIKQQLQDTEQEIRLLKCRIEGELLISLVQELELDLCLATSGSKVAKNDTELLVQAIKNKASSTDAWTRVYTEAVGSAPCDDAAYQTILDNVIDARQREKHYQKSSRFWKTQAISGGSPKGLVTPSLSTIPSIDTKMDERRRHSMDTYLQRLSCSLSERPTSTSSYSDSFLKTIPEDDVASPKSRNSSCNESRLDDISVHDSASNSQRSDEIEQALLFHNFNQTFKDPVEATSTFEENSLPTQQKKQHATTGSTDSASHPTTALATASLQRICESWPTSSTIASALSRNSLSTAGSLGTLICDPSSGTTASYVGKDCAKMANGVDFASDVSLESVLEFAPLSHAESASSLLLNAPRSLNGVKSATVLLSGIPGPASPSVPVVDTQLNIPSDIGGLDQAPGQQSRYEGLVLWKRRLSRSSPKRKT